MTTAAKLLKMIEDVSPDNTGNLDEIDARVWCFVTKNKFLGVMKNGFRYQDSDEYTGVNTNRHRFTRSRDALKAIRPKGKVSWIFFNNYPEGSRARAEIFHDQGNNPIQTDWLPTEELAELHSIIQAIEYERTAPVPTIDIDGIHKTR